ncbi:MAG: GNAT family N-acetyltransferase [Chloroflexi bacterium]|nr:GNAT family N-acetyltransferase [Chloroflexota bacterium]
MSHSIVEYGLEDAPRVAEMWRASQSGWPGGVNHAMVTRDGIERRVRNTRNLAIFLANADGKVVGWCNLTREFSEPQHAYIHVLNVVPEYHGQGIGRDLLRAAFDRAMALGFRRLDLHTWSGNRGAIPLYKRMGFFWTPGTRVKMQNYLPTVLRSHLVEAFLAGADWYRALRQPTELVEDDHQLDGRPVYAYVFERDQRRLRIVVDRGSEEVLAVDGPGFTVGLIAPTQLAIGRTAWARCSVETTEEIVAGPGALWADGVLAAERRVIGTARPEACGQLEDLPLAAGARGNGRIQAELLVAGCPLHLAAAVEGVAPLAVVPRERIWAVRGANTGFAPPGRFPVDIRNHTDAIRMISLRCLADDALEVGGEPGPVSVAGGETRTVVVEVQARRTGCHRLRLVAHADNVDGVPGSADVVVAAPAFGEVLAYTIGDETVLEGERTRVAVARVGGRVTIFDGVSNRQAATVDLLVGPPYWPSETAACAGEVSTLATGWTVPEVRHVIPVPELPGVRLERRVALEAGGRVQIGATVHNGSANPIEPGLRWVVNPASPAREVLGEPHVAIPLGAGLVVSPAINFPDLPEAAIGPEEFAENWLAYQDRDNVVGVHWRHADRIGWDDWRGPTLVRDGGLIPPGGHRELEPIEVWAGAGDWRVARAQWYLAPADHLVPASPLRIALNPAVLVVGPGHPGGQTAGVRCDLAVSSERRRPSDVRVEVTTTDGVRAEEWTATLPRVVRGQPATVSSSLLRICDSPGMDTLTVRATSSVDGTVREVPVVRLARGADGCSVREEVDEGRSLVSIDNGWATLRIAPDFAGTVVGWVHGGINHLFTAYPRSDVYAWFGPWFGGIGPSLSSPDDDTTGRPGLLAREAWSREPVRERRGERMWAGVRLWARPAVLPWLGVEVEYLTLPGSALLLATLKLANSGPSGQACQAGFNAFVQPGGTRAGAAFHWSPDRAPYVPQRFQADWLRGNRWAAVEGAGATISATALTSETRVSGLAIGERGADLFVSARPTIEAGASFELAVLFALASGAEEARRYRLLGGAAPI